MSGYFEPKGDDMDDDMFYGQEGEDDEDDDEEQPRVKGTSVAAVKENLK